MEVSGQLHAPAALSHRKQPNVLVVNRMLGGPLNSCEYCGKEKTPAPALNPNVFKNRVEIFVSYLISSLVSIFRYKDVLAFLNPFHCKLT
jgi:hypothetical protein